MKANMIYVPDLVARQAFAAVGRAGATRSWGCARCYVTFCGRLSTSAERALVSAGFRVTPRPGHKGRHIYIGYDNMTGHEYARAMAVAAVLNEAGVSCYEDADGD